MKLFRGLGLPLKAIKKYEEMIEPGTEFEFNGFTSTSVKME